MKKHEAVSGVRVKRRDPLDEAAARERYVILGRVETIYSLYYEVIREGDGERLYFRLEEIVPSGGEK